VSFFAAGAETAGRQDEDLLGDGVDLADALVVVDHGHGGLSHAKGDGPGLAHVAVAGDGAPLSRLLAGAPGRQADQADALLQVGLAVQLEQGDIVVQSLRIVVVVDVGGGHAQRLGAGRAELLRQVVVAHPHVDGVSRADDAAKRERRGTR